MADKAIIDYHIQCITPSDYELEFKIPADNKIFLMLFNKAKEKLLRERGIKVKDANPEVIGEFEVPEYYYKFLKVTIKKIYSNARERFKKRGIELLNYNIKKAGFKRNEKNDWDITIMLFGIYADKR